MRNKPAFGEAMYRALLYLYPASFRSEYGEEMRLTFRDARRSAYRQRGATGVIALWLATLYDLCKSALEVRMRRGEVTMSRERFSRAASPLTTLVGVMLLIASLGEFMIYIEPRNGDTFWDFFWVPWLLLGYGIMPAALVAIYQRYQDRTGSLARIGLGLSLAAVSFLLATIVTGVVIGIIMGETQPAAWVLAIPDVCAVAISAGFILFGIDALRKRLLPWGNWLPLLAGAAIIFKFVPDMAGVGNYDSLRLGTYALHYAVAGISLILFGFAIRNSGTAQANNNGPEKNSSPADQSQVIRALAG